MRDLNDFRSINEFEKSIIRNTLNKISRNNAVSIENIIQKLYISYNRDFVVEYSPSIYLLSTNHINLIEIINNYHKISSIGLYFGFIKKENFHLSLEGAEFLVKNDYITKDKILITNISGEKSILYGNDIKPGDVMKFPEDFKKGDILFIFNSDNEIIAIAQSVINKLDLKQLNINDKVALNLIDRGYYLRKKQ